MPNIVNIQPRAGVVLGIQTLAVAGTAVAPTIPAGTTHMIVDNSTANPVRYRLDGGTPTNAIGNRLLGFAQLNYSDLHGDFTAFIAGFKAIRESTDSTLEFLYLRFSNPI